MITQKHHMPQQGLVPAVFPPANCVDSDDNRAVIRDGFVGEERTLTVNLMIYHHFPYQIGTK